MGVKILEILAARFRGVRDPVLRNCAIAHAVNLSATH